MHNKHNKLHSFLYSEVIDSKFTNFINNNTYIYIHSMIHTRTL